MGLFDRIGRELGKIGSGLGRIVTGTVGGVIDVAAPAVLGGLSAGLSERVAAAISGGSDARGGGLVIGSPQGSLATAATRFNLGRVAPVSEGSGMPFALPGGAPIQRAGFLPDLPLFPGIGEFLGLAPGAGSGVQAIEGGCIVPRATARRMPSIVRTTHPDTGRDVWYRNAGRPILWSGDFAASRRVSRVASRARRRSRGGR